ncbi:protein Shroom4-like isoform X2 [Myxocyprinus asiaticus]|uniref:protein Shroom4-like isoform X2 n=1 Tax=Myxocyprinus asiaticus TaxID=70543 RepID=UPI0022236C06|nr:protein Shroom4-like isoform X2 [Myxocyprinus asiaticus]
MDGTESTNVLMDTLEQLVSFQHIHVQLNGGAPWGFTLKGGLEHGEPLIITKIEEDGKAAQCKKLRVGDELVNINGSALYGSRQEALILIKGSYRVLKIVVRRRSVPLIRPHSWNLTKLSEAPCTTGTADASDGPPAMQLHLTPFSVPWHSGGDNSELSMQWGHISRHYSTDRSSSIGSMESLENPPNQGSYDSQLSPIDPVIFNNKRDSAYSSFSASSNTSDYTVSVKPEEINSMDSLLQGLGSSCRYPGRGQHSAQSGHGGMQDQSESLKSKILSYRPEAKVRPSSYSCEEEHCAPPQPPMRKGNFRATRGITDKRCVSAPVGIPSLTSCMVEKQPPIQEVLTGNVYLNGMQDNEQDLKGKIIEPYYTFNSQRESGRESKAREGEKNHLENQSKSVERSPLPLSPFLKRNSDEHFDTQLQPESSLQPAMHRHSAPEKLLASQLRMMDFSSDKSDRSDSPTCQWSQSPLYMREASPEMAQVKWAASRCSTPGSLATSELEDPGLEEETLESGQNLWGQSINVSGNPVGIPGHGSTTNSQTLLQNFGPLSATVCVDTHINENGGGELRVDDGNVTKQSQKRQFRTSKSRRRSERFATNLRNEIQRKKAQLQKSKSPSGLPCGEETLEEEQVGDVNMEPVSPPDNHQHRDQTLTSPLTNPPTASKQAPQVPSHDTTQAKEHSRTMVMNCQTSQTQPQISQHRRPVCVQVVEEMAPAGKPRRWRWTPEHKLQPETEPTESKKNETKGSIWSGKTGTTRGRTSSTSGYLGRSDECDILPFADRRRFFEESSRKLSQSVTNLSSLTSRNQRPEKQSRRNNPSSPEPLELATNLGRRRFSYQGVVQEGPYVNALDTRGHFMSTYHDQEKARERLIEREREKEQERERKIEQERIKELERLQEQERHKDLEKERERELERLREEKEKEQQRVEDWEERQRLLKREKVWESERESIHSEHNIRSNTVPHSLSHDAYRKQPPSPLDPSSFQSSENYCSNTATNIQKPCSAFHPVTGQHSQYDGYYVNPSYNVRSYTPSEAHPAREREQTKINRKFSLTERDYSRCRKDSRIGEGAGCPGFVAQYINSVAGGSTEEHPGLFSPLRNRAMSESDISVKKQDRHNHISNTNMSRMRASTLSELDENRVCVGEVKKKKVPPPPRPPPPKWEQFHKRRASHHNLFSSHPLVSSPSSSPPWPQQCTSRPPSVPEMTRQCSYSLPPKDVPENHHCCCQDYSAAPPSPAFVCRAFKPVAPAAKDRDIAPQSYDMRREFDQPLPQPEPSTSFRVLVHTATVSEHEPKAMVKANFHEHRVEWDRSSPHHSVAQSTSRFVEVPEKSSSAGPVCPESYFSMNNYHLHPQQAGIPGTAHKKHISSHSPSGGEDGNMPLETDIDEICENERAGEVETREAEGRMEMKGFARPVMVLETDIDNMPEEKAPSARIIRGPRGSLVDFILEEDYGITRKELIGELFPQSAEIGMGGESWRGGYPISGGTLERPSKMATSTAQASRSICYDTSTDNSQLLAKIREISERKEEEEELNYKKQLMESLCKKLGVLREAQRSLQEDIRANAQLGEEVESLVLAICKPNEVDKYRMFIGDLDKVTSLLLSLSGRLLRVESALDCVDPESGHGERLQLLEKKKQLLVQMGEAQELKEHVDRREQAVGMVLGRCLTPEQMRDYGHFVKMKAALLVEQRQLDDKIRLGEEQLRGLRESLGLGLGVGLGFGHY